MPQPLVDLLAPWCGGLVSLGCENPSVCAIGGYSMPKSCKISPSFFAHSASPLAFGAPAIAVKEELAIATSAC